MKPFLLLLSIGLCVPAWAQNTVSVHVIDPNQKPFADAYIALSVWGEDQTREETLHTDATGTATFSLAKPVDATKPVGQVVVHAKGFALAGSSINSNALEFKLQPGVTWRGTVTDKAGHPLQGATLRPSLIWQPKTEKGQDAINLYQLKELRAIYSAQSGADGTFQIADLPPGGQLSYEVAQPHWALNTGWRVPIKDVAHVTLEPGATVRGRLLGLDGKPLANVKVFAQEGKSGGYGEAQTATDGTFSFDSLSTGQYNVIVEAPEKAAFVVPALEGVVAVLGQPLELPDMRAIEGVVVSGLVRDKISGQPLAGAKIGVQDASRPQSGAAIILSDKTGADGRFSVRVIAGRSKFYFYQTPTNFLGNGVEQTLDVAANKPTPVIFELQKLPLLTGTTVDENNRPIKAQLRFWGDQLINSDEQGQWSWQATAFNTIFVGGGEDESGYFDVLSNQQWKVPSPAPLVVRVRKHPWQALQGRVVSRDKTPLAGVEVKASFFFELGDDGGLGQTIRTATTDAQGRYSFAQIRGGDQNPNDMASNLKVSVERKDLAFVSGGEISKEGTNWTASDLVLSALNRRIEGQTVPGARVVAAGKETLADDAGHFAFEGLPEGETLVCAAANGKFGSVLASDADKTPFHIELAPVQAQGVDAQMGRQAWLEVSREGADAGYYALDWVNSQLAVQGGDSFAALKRTDTGPTTANADWQLAAQLAKWAPKLPAEGRVAALEEVASGITRPEIRLEAWLDSAMSSDDPKVAKRALAEADTALALTPPEFAWRESNLYHLAIVAEKAGGKEAGQTALNRAMAWTLAHHPEKSFSKQGQIIEPSANQFLGWETAIVAQGSDELFRQLLDSVEPDNGENVPALSEAIPVVARVHGVEAALVLLEELGRMPMPDFKGDNHASNNEPKWAFNQAARRLIVPLAQKSPQRALELARRVTDAPGRALALASAAPFQTPDEAAKLWREAIMGADVGNAARFAAQAWEHDPKLGVELFALVRQKIDVDTATWRGSAWPTYAFYFARVDPASARLELEREWAAQMLTGGDAGESIARAMAAVDGKRALEMARALGKDNSRSLDVRRKIGQYLMASTDQRRDLPFDRWGAGDTWQPGDAEW